LHKAYTKVEGNSPYYFSRAVCDKHAWVGWILDEVNFVNRENTFTVDKEIPSWKKVEKSMRMAWKAYSRF
jgi:hypothetical protein